MENKPQSHAELRDKLSVIYGKWHISDINHADFCEQTHDLIARHVEAHTAPEASIKKNVDAMMADAMAAPNNFIAAYLSQNPDVNVGSIALVVKSIPDGVEYTIIQKPILEPVRTDNQTEAITGTTKAEIADQLLAVIGTDGPVIHAVREALNRTDEIARADQHAKTWAMAAGAHADQGRDAWAAAKHWYDEMGRMADPAELPCPPLEQGGL